MSELENLQKIKLLLAGGEDLSARQIGDKLGLSGDYVKYRIKREGLETNQMRRLRVNKELASSKKKECSKCSKIYPFDNFHPDSRAADKLTSECKTCRNAEILVLFHKKYNDPAEKEIILERARKWKANHSRELKEYSKQYHIDHRLERAEYQSQYYENNREKFENYNLERTGKARKERSILRGPIYCLLCDLELYSFHNPKYCSPQHARFVRRICDYGGDIEIARKAFKVDKCEACGTAKDKWLCVDHDHATGLYRGMLCNDCNFALGHLKDDSNKIWGVMAFLTKEQIVLPQAIKNAKSKECLLCTKPVPKENRKYCSVYCKERAQSIMARFKLSINQYLWLIESQNNRCASCGEIFQKTPVIDHCHIEGYIRGLLCGLCNSAIGHLKDDPKRANMLLAYLLRGL